MKNHNKLPTGTTGAMNELIVSADLMDKGYHVFRALSPHCPCDIMVMKNHTIQRVEVTSGYMHKDGIGFSWPRHDPKKYDVLALVFKDGRIIYTPDMK